MTAWLLVHSPLLGPASWSAVAAELWDAGDSVLVPDLRPALTGGPGYAERQAAFAAGAAPAAALVVAGHSGAGPLLPSVVEAVTAAGGRVERCLFVDAGLPHPGRSRRSTFPPELIAHLDALSEDGGLPPWPRWWPDEALAELLPDAATRAALEADSPRLPAGLFDEPLPCVDALPPAGYVQLSDAYAEPAAAAEAAGWPLRRLPSDHLAVLSRPAEVARVMRDVLAETSELRNAARRHVIRFNAAVRDRNWSAFAATFAPDATMRFTNAPIGPFVGHAEIERSYLQQPPNDTMAITSLLEVSADSVQIDFSWDSGGEGSMVLRWVDGLVADLTITFG